MSDSGTAKNGRATIPGAQPLIPGQAPKRRNRKKLAAGFRAVAESASYGDRQAGVRNTARPYLIPLRCAAAYDPETNVLVHINSTADGSNCPTSKSIVITVTPSSERLPARG